MKYLNEIHQIWDRLADYPAAQSQQALRYLLKEINQLIGADTGYWLSAFRLDELDASRDFMLGWRPGPICFSEELPEVENTYKKYIKEIDSGRYEVGESTLNHLKQSGKFRATLLRDHVSADFLDSDFYANKFKSRNVTDTLYVVAPLNADTEAYFCFHRISRQTPFTSSDLDIASYTLRSLNWFQKKVFLSYGLLVAEKPLTHTEKKVMHLLLTDLSEKQIADKLQQKADTIHKHIVNIYRKFNVNSRAGLMAIWLGHF
jgi:DNA-binding CsgD family transcriptional regulator